MVRSGPADPSVGLMDDAYFTSRKDIIDFFNNLLHMNLTKIEQTATGAVACQLMDYVFPGSVPMKRVNWEARSDFQFLENYKILQAAFTKNNVQKYVDVDRLIRAKYQDNLEFCQWLKAFFEHAAVDLRGEYNSVSRRAVGKGGKNLQAHFLPRSGGETRSQSSYNLSSCCTGFKSSRSFPSSHKAPVKNTPSTSCGTSAHINRDTIGSVGSHCRTNRTWGAQQSQDRGADAILMKKKSELLKKNAELDIMLERVEKERDFYFEKLRGIEVMLQVHEENAGASDANELTDNIFKVLYAKSEDNVVVNDDGKLQGNISHLENENNLLIDSSEGILDESIIPGEF